jgi:para-aminobenzoate synthetase
VRWHDELTVGAGGAIVLDSDPHAEYDEMLLKAEAPLRALPLTTRALVIGQDSRRRPSAP